MVRAGRHGKGLGPGPGTLLEEELALRPSSRRHVCFCSGGRVGWSAPLSLLVPGSQTQLPQQKLQLQEACTRKEKSVAVLEHQLVEAEVRG